MNPPTVAFISCCLLLSGSFGRSVISPSPGTQEVKLSNSISLLNWMSERTKFVRKIQENSLLE